MSRAHANTAMHASSGIAPLAVRALDSGAPPSSKHDRRAGRFPISTPVQPSEIHSALDSGPAARCPKPRGFPPSRAAAPPARSTCTERLHGQGSPVRHCPRDRAHALAATKDLVAPTKISEMWYLSISLSFGDAHGPDLLPRPPAVRPRPFALGRPQTRQRCVATFFRRIHVTLPKGMVSE